MKVHNLIFCRTSRCIACAVLKVTTQESYSYPYIQVYTSKSERKRLSEKCYAGYIAFVLLRFSPFLNVWDEWKQVQMVNYNIFLMHFYESVSWTVSITSCVQHFHRKLKRRASTRMWPRGSPVYFPTSCTHPFVNNFIDILQTCTEKDKWL